jgi:pimeloyl-ACP methyl ester carboxylesterase
MKMTLTWIAAMILNTFFLPTSSADAPIPAPPFTATAALQVNYRTVNVDGVDVFYREAGPQDGPVLILRHGFPTSSHMFRDLITRLDDKGYGYSGAPDHKQFAYTFDNYASIVDKLTDQIGVKRHALYVMDHGAPVGFRLAAKHPDRITAIIVQNGNAYDESIGKFWDPIKAYWETGAAKEREGIRWLMLPKTTLWQYSNGFKDASLVSPDARTLDQLFLDRPGNQEIQLDLIYDYRTNIPLYPQWQAYFRKYKPPMLIVWGKNDEIFLAAGAEPFKRDIPKVEIHMFDTGHFALESNGPEIAALIREFLGGSVG